MDIVSHPISRRAFIAGAAAAATGAACRERGARPKPPAPTVRRGLLLSPERDHGGLPFSLGVLDTETGAAVSVPLDLLGHSVVGHPTLRHLAVVLGQRPGRLSCVVDLQAAAVVAKFEAGAGRHFYGHGTFSPDGTRLYTTENAIADGVGVVVVRDTAGWSVVGELPSHGVGPHDLRPLDGGKAFVIANGGLPTDPAGPAPAVDYARMDASLVIVDASSGKLLERHRVSDPHVSVRHLATAPDGSLAVGLNRFGPARVTPMLLVRSGRTEPVVELTPPPSLALRMSGTLSLAIAPDVGVVAVTSKGSANLVTFWSVHAARFLGHLDVPSPNGVVVSEDGRRFLVTTAEHGLVAVDARSLQPVDTPWESSGLNWRHSSSWRT